MYCRKLEKEDAKILFDLIDQIEGNLQNQKWWLPINEVSRRHFFDNEWTYFIGLFDNEKLIGAGGLFLNEHEFGESLKSCKDVVFPVAEMGRGMILPEYRGHNYSLDIIKELIKVAKTKGIKTILVTSHPDNEAGQCPFFKVGAKKVARIVKNNDFERDILLFTI